MIDLATARVPAAKPPRGVLGPGTPLDGAAPGRRRPLSTPPRTRRVSGPSRRRSTASRSGGRVPGSRRIALRRGAAIGVLRFPAELLFGWLGRVRLRWAERLSRQRLAGALRAAVLGRTWIALVAFALIGIVTLQLGLLKLNASIGRGLEHEALLQRQNAQLSIENSETDASASIQSRAERLGMELVPPGLLRYLSARPGADTNSAAAALNAPVGSSASGSSEASASAQQAQSGVSPASAGTSAAGTEATSTPAATSASPSGSQGAPASEPGASSTGSSPPATTTAPEAPSATPSEPAAAPSPGGGSFAGAPAAGGSGEAPPGGGTQTASPGG